MTWQVSNKLSDGATDSNLQPNHTHIKSSAQYAQKEVEVNKTAPGTTDFSEKYQVMKMLAFVHFVSVSFLSLMVETHGDFINTSMWKRGHGECLFFIVNFI